MGVPTRAVIVDVAGLPTDVGRVGALARLQLNARRRDTGIRLRQASPELQELLSLVGLRDVLDVEAGGAGEERGQQLGGRTDGIVSSGCPDAATEA